MPKPYRGKPYRGHGQVIWPEQLARRLERPQLEAAAARLRAAEKEAQRAARDRAARLERKQQMEEEARQKEAERAIGSR